MATMFLICAVLGGTILVCQTLLVMLGLAGDSLHLDLPHDGVSEGGGDLHGDGVGGTESGDGGHGEAHHLGSSWLFAVLSFRTLVAAMAFFGLAGLGAQAAELPVPTVLLIATSAGVGAMYGVYWMMQALYRLRSEGTVRVQRAVGREATVYLRIPGQRAGCGKVLLELQSRTMEYEAMTSGPELPTGARVVVTSLISPDTLEVSCLPESERNRNE